MIRRIVTLFWICWNHRPVYGCSIKRNKRCLKVRLLKNCYQDIRQSHVIMNSCPDLGIFRDSFFFKLKIGSCPRFRIPLSTTMRLFNVRVWCSPTSPLALPNLMLNFGNIEVCSKSSKLYFQHFFKKSFLSMTLISGLRLGTFWTNCVHCVTLWISGSLSLDVSVLSLSMLQHCNPMTQEGSILALQKLLHST